MKWSFQIEAAFAISLIIYNFLVNIKNLDLKSQFERKESYSSIKSGDAQTPFNQPNNKRVINKPFNKIAFIFLFIS